MAVSRTHNERQAAPGQPPIQVDGAFPHLTVMAPGAESRTEAGIGALIPWADRLWAVGYVAHISGSGLGLYEIDERLNMRRRPESVTGTFANRLVHWDSEQVFIGPHAVDAEGNVRTIEDLKHHRLTASMRHLHAPAGMVYFLTMEGLLFEVDVKTLEARRLADLVEELEIPDGVAPHFKGGFTAQGRVVVANNSYHEEEFLGQRAAGRLAEWDGETWTILERNPFVEVSGKMNPGPGAAYGNSIFATGWDRSSAILRVLHDGTWTRYRLPKASQTFDHAWNTEWMRIREAQTERYLMDLHGMFYDLTALVYNGRIWGVRPICTHLRMTPDFCYWRGMLVLASDQTDNAVGQPQSGFLFRQIDDLWNWGKPAGWGGPWWKDDIEAHTPSDPYLMTGFDKKGLHLTQESAQPVTFRVEVDFLGDGSWMEYESFLVAPGGYVHHEFPDAFSAHWVRLSADKPCQATAHFIYS